MTLDEILDPSLYEINEKGGKYYATEKATGKTFPLLPAVRMRFVESPFVERVREMRSAQLEAAKGKSKWALTDSKNKEALVDDFLLKMGRARANGN